MNTFKKSIFILGLFLLGSTIIKAQNSVGIGTLNPNSNTALELVGKDNQQGFLVPRLTTTERASFATKLTIENNTANNGIMIFDSEEKAFYFWMDTDWVPVKTASGGAANTITLANVTGLSATDVQAAIEELNTNIQGATDDQTSAEVTYDNTLSGLTAVDVKAAIDELNTNIQGATDDQTSTEVTYDNTLSGLTAVDVKTAIDELNTNIQGATDDQTSAEVTYDNTLSGLTAVDVKTALDELNTNIQNGSAASLPVDGTGIMSGNLDMGSNQILNIDSIGITGLVNGRDISADGAHADSIQNLTGAIPGTSFYPAGSFAPGGAIDAADDGVTILEALIDLENATAMGTSFKNIIGDTISFDAAGNDKILGIPDQATGNARKLTIASGSSATGGTGGDLEVLAGDGAANFKGGSLGLFGGNGNGTSGGGDVLIEGGAANGTSGIGGNILLTGGFGQGTENGGNIVLNPGSAGGTGTSGSVIVGEDPGFGGAAKFIVANQNSNLIAGMINYSSVNDEAPTFVMLRARGTIGSEAAVEAGDRIGRLEFNAHNGTPGLAGFADVAVIKATATTAHGPTNRGTEMTFETTHNDSINSEERMFISHDGKVGIGISPIYALDIEGTDAIRIPSGTDAERPGSPVAGLMRYNFDGTEFEGFDGSSWVSLSATSGGGSLRNIADDTLSFDNTGVPKTMGLLDTSTVSPGSPLFIFSGSSTTNNGGDLGIAAGQGQDIGGNLNLTAGNATSGIGQGGNATISGGLGDAVGGTVAMAAGDASNGDGGIALLNAGNGSNDGGNVIISAGDGASGFAGNIILTPGNGGTGPGAIQMAGNMDLIGSSSIFGVDTIQANSFETSNLKVIGDSMTLSNDGNNKSMGVDSVASGLTGSSLAISAGNGSNTGGNIVLNPGKGSSANGGVIIGEDIGLSGLSKFAVTNQNSDLVVAALNYSEVSDEGPTLALGRARGNFGSEAAVQAGDRIGELEFTSHDGTPGLAGFNDAAGITATATTAHSATNRGAEMVFATTHNDSTDSQDRLFIGHDGKIGIGVPPLYTLDIQGTDAIRIPSGSDAERPGSPVAGLMRYNFEGTKFEGYDGGSWVPLSSSGGVDSLFNLPDPEITFGNDGASRTFGFSAPASATDGSKLEIRGGDGDGVSKGGDIEFRGGAGGTSTPGGNILLTPGTGNGGTLGYVGIGTAFPSVTLDIQTTDAIRVPSGTVAERPVSPVDGQIRYNTDNFEYEGFNGSWVSLSAISGVDSLFNLPDPEITFGNDGASRTFGFSAPASTTDGSKLEIRGGDGDGVSKGGDIEFRGGAGGTSTPGGNILLTPGTGNGGTLGYVGIGTINPAVTLDIIANDAIQLPVGMTGERPGSPTNGLMRYNTDQSQFEGYVNAAWVSLSSVPQDLTQDITFLNDINPRTIGMTTAAPGSLGGLTVRSGASSDANGSNLNLTAGNGGSTFQGGSIILTPGTAGGGTDGNVQVNGVLDMQGNHIANAGNLNITGHLDVNNGLIQNVDSVNTNKIAVNTEMTVGGAANFGGALIYSVRTADAGTPGAADPVATDRIVHIINAGSITVDLDVSPLPNGTVLTFIIDTADATFNGVSGSYSGSTNFVGPARVTYVKLGPANWIPLFGGVGG